MFACYDADSFVPADQKIVSEVWMDNGFIGKIVTDSPGNPLPKPVPVEDALSRKLPDGTYEKWRKEKNRYPSKVIGEIWLKSLDKIRRRAAEVNQVRTDYKLAPVKSDDTGAAAVVVLCGAKFDNLETMDEHVERVHTGDIGLRSLPAATRVDGRGRLPIQDPASSGPATVARTAPTTTTPTVMECSSYQRKATLLLTQEADGLKYAYFCDYRAKT